MTVKSKRKRQMLRTTLYGSQNFNNKPNGNSETLSHTLYFYPKDRMVRFYYSLGKKIKSSVQPSFIVIMKIVIDSIL